MMGRSVHPWIKCANFPCHCRDEFPQGGAAKWHDRHVLFEYVMLKGVNDRVEHAHEFLDLVKGIECKLNLIVFNPHEGTLYEASDDATVKEFRSVVIQGGRVCTIRDSRGSSEMAACGQLGNPSLSRLLKQA
jgi:23S rRNA (adenine2503-C2)-methyltransferase